MTNFAKGTLPNMAIVALFIEAKEDEDMIIRTAEAARANVLDYIDIHPKPAEGDLDDLIIDLASTYASEANNQSDDGDDDEVHARFESLASEVNNQGVAVQLLAAFMMGASDHQIFQRIG